MFNKIYYICNLIEKMYLKLLRVNLLTTYLYDENIFIRFIVNLIYCTVVSRLCLTERTNQIQLNKSSGVGLVERLAHKPANQVGLGSNPTRGNRLKI